MPTDETLLTVLLIALAANLGLMVLFIIASWIRGRRRRVDDSAPIQITPATVDAARQTARAAAAQIGRPAAAPAAPTPPTAQAPGQEPGPSMQPRQTPMDARSPSVSSAPTFDDLPARRASDEPRPAPGERHDQTPTDTTDHLTDPATGLDSPRGWSRTLTDEMARVARYRRPASIVLVEVEGLDRLVDRFGADAAERLLPVISETLRKNARAADHVAALDRGRYGVLLTETDEVRAINFIERVRTACDGWLAAGAVTLRLAIGWADANAGRTIDDAVATAEDRLNLDRRRPQAVPDRGPSTFDTGPTAF